LSLLYGGKTSSQNLEKRTTAGVYVLNSPCLNIC
jgi:hypothetical protein